MPRQRQRIVFCDCFDCRDRPEEPTLSAEQLDAATAVAGQEPPPKALLLYATGFVLADEAVTNLDSCTLPHCNLVVREGNLGLLATRSSKADTGLPPAVSELSQLLGIYSDVCRPSPPASGEAGAEQDAGLPSLAARFKGMQAALASTSRPACQLALRLGMAVPERLCIGAAGSEASGEPGAAPEKAPDAAGEPAAANASSSGPGQEQEQGPRGAVGKGGLSGVLPNAGAFAKAVSSELGAAEGNSGCDLLLLHLDLDDLIRVRAAGPVGSVAEAAGGLPPAAGGAQEAGGGQAVAAASGGDEAEKVAGAGAEAKADARWDAGCEALEWLDGLVKALLALPEIRERTLLALLVSPAGSKLPPVPGQGGAAAGALLQPGGAPLDPAAVVITPRSAAQVGRATGAAVAAAAAAGSVSTALAGAGGALAVLEAEEFPLVSRPVQSFEILGMSRVNVDLNAPVLVARRLPGVVRRDRAERLGYREALTAGGQGAMMLDRLLPEVAYKIGRAPKYGA